MPYTIDADGPYRVSSGYRIDALATPSRARKVPTTAMQRDADLLMQRSSALEALRAKLRAPPRNEDDDPEEIKDELRQAKER